MDDSELAIPEATRGLNRYRISVGGMAERTKAAVLKFDGGCPTLCHRI